MVLSFGQVETDSWTASFKMYMYVYEPNTGKHASVSRDTNKGRRARSSMVTRAAWGPRAPEAFVQLGLNGFEGSQVSQSVNL